jgi:hypothetical protein
MKSNKRGGARRGSGRKPTPGDKQKSVNLTMRVTPPEAEAILSEKRPGESISDLLRRLMGDRLKNLKTP